MPSRNLELLACREEPIPKSKDKRRPPHRRRIIHARSGHWDGNGEGQEDDDVDPVQHGEQVDRNAPPAQIEGAVGWVTALDLPNHDQGDRDDVADVERERGERQNGVESRGRTDVDQGQ
jgi:hypothetical protein